MVLALTPVAAGMPRAVAPGTLRQTEELVARSVVRINRRTVYRVRGQVRQALNFGTGVIVGEERIDGHREYLILSNEHVARNERVAGENTLSIAGGFGVKAPIALETLEIDARRDQALLRTVHCDASFTVPDYVIGLPEGDAKEAVAFTEGYGNGRFNTLVGDIVSTRSKYWGLRCYRFDKPVGGGQSGAPLVVIGADRKLYLAALIFCGDDEYTGATPLQPGKGVLRELEMELRAERL